MRARASDWRWRYDRRSHHVGALASCAGYALRLRFVRFVSRCYRCVFHHVGVIGFVGALVRFASRFVALLRVAHILALHECWRLALRWRCDFTALSHHVRVKCVTLRRVAGVARSRRVGGVSRRGRYGIAWRRSVCVHRGEGGRRGRRMLATLRFACGAR